MDSTEIMTHQQATGVPGGLVFGLFASSGLWLIIAELRYFL